MSRDHHGLLDQAVAQLTAEAEPGPLGALLDAPASTLHGGLSIEAAPALTPVVGQLLALEASTCRAWVTWPGRTDSAAQLARSVVALHGGHVGQDVVLMFEQGDPARPLVMGVIQTPAGWPLASTPPTVEVDVDAQRMVIASKAQLVLRCGRASITLHQSGRVEIEGTNVISRSTGINRIQGGSIQLN